VKIAGLVLLAAWPAQEAADRFVDRVTFGDARPGGEAGDRVVAALRSAENWRAAFRAIEARLGPMPAEMAVAVTFDYDGEEMAKATSKGALGAIRFNLRKLEEHQKRVDDLEKQKKDLAREGKRLVFRVPPARLDRILWHELTHIFHGELAAPEWFSEGLAQWLADDPNCLRAFVFDGRDVEEIEAPPGHKNDVYARGHLFWSWVATRGATKSAVKLAVVEHGAWKASLEKALGLGWDDIVRSEREWSSREVARMR
jgi:hypothetical protein